MEGVGKAGTEGAKREPDSVADAARARVAKLLGLPLDRPSNR